MINIKKVYFFAFSLLFLIQGVFASKLVESFATVKNLFTNTVVLDGFAIFFIFVGFYTLYYMLLHFFIKNAGSYGTSHSNNRPRIVIAAMLSFFSGSTIIFALKDASNGIAVAAGSWLFLLLLIPGTIAVAFKFIMFVKSKKDLSTIGKILLGSFGLLAIDFLFTNFLIWASKNANVGGISANILEKLLTWNQTIYDFLLFMFFIGLIGFVIYLITNGGLGSNSNKVSAEKKNRNEMKHMLNEIKQETKTAEDILSELNNNLKMMGNLRNPQKEDLGISNGYASGTYSPQGGKY